MLRKSEEQPETIKERCIKLFSLLPSNNEEKWLIAADWMEEQGDPLAANNWRNKNRSAPTNGDGNGDGYGNGDGDGYGDGNGYGDGYGNGNGNGYGYGDGYGYGNGNGNGYGYGNGYG